MNVNDGSVVCPTCGSGTLGYSAMKHAQRAEKAEARVAELEAVLSHVAAWTHAYGSELVPSGVDSYGEGVRDCKARVARIIGEMAPPPVGVGGVEAGVAQLVETGRGSAPPKPVDGGASRESTGILSPLAAGSSPASSLDPTNAHGRRGRRVHGSVATASIESPTKRRCARRVLEPSFAR